MWNVYIVECADKTLYTGSTTEINRRLKEHNSGKGAKYTRGRYPVTLKLVIPARDRSSAQKIEAALKKMTAEDKRVVIQAGGLCKVWNMK